MSDEMKVPAGCMENARGAFVPMQNIRPVDLAEDAFVKSVFANAEPLHRGLAAFRGASLDGVEKHVQERVEEYGVRPRKSKGKGNVTLTSYDGKLILKKSVADRITLGPEIQAAKELVDECLRDWSKGGNEYLVAAVNGAFRTHRGQIKISRVLDLLNYEIDDPQWLEAMRALKDSLQVTGSATYIRLYRRDEHGREVPMSLDIAVL